MAACTCADILLNTDCALLKFIRDVFYMDMREFHLDGTTMRHLSKKKSFQSGRPGKFAFINIYGPFQKGIQKSLPWIGHIANSWDEWVGVDRLLKHTEENVMKQQALQKKQGTDKSSKSGRSSQSKQKSSSG